LDCAANFELRSSNSFLHGGVAVVVIVPTISIDGTMAGRRRVSEDGNP